MYAWNVATRLAPVALALSATSAAPTEDDAMAAYLIADVDTIDAGMASLTAWYDSPE